LKIDNNLEDSDWPSSEINSESDYVDDVDPEPRKVRARARKEGEPVKEPSGFWSAKKKGKGQAGRKKTKARTRRVVESEEDEGQTVGCVPDVCTLGNVEPDKLAEEDEVDGMMVRVFIELSFRY
jgi:hypothetical protein